LKRNSPIKPKIEKPIKKKKDRNINKHFVKNKIIKIFHQTCPKIEEKLANLQKRMNEILINISLQKKEISRNVNDVNTMFC